MFERPWSPHRPNGESAATERRRTTAPGSVTYTGLLDDTDFGDTGAALERACSVTIVVYENTWAASFAAALRRNGAQLVAAGRGPVRSILTSLEVGEDRT